MMSRRPGECRQAGLSLCRDSPHYVLGVLLAKLATAGDAIEKLSSG